MSVYTEVTANDLQPLLQHYRAGKLQALLGIRDGIENTNYFVTTDRGEYVLTLFEHTHAVDIEFALDCMAHYVRLGLPCAAPLADPQGHFLSHLHDKPASLVTRLPGQSLTTADTEQCRVVGHNLARLHLAGRDITVQHPNPRGEHWRQLTADKIRARLDAGQRRLLDDELTYQHCSLDNLPHGIIHADLFRDNILFEGHHLTGLLDFYNAGYDLLLYDLAITVTDWCTRSDGSFHQPRLQALVQAYTRQRPVTENEQRHWPQLLRRAALRFWLSRHVNLHFPRASQLTRQKDPAVYQQLLLTYRQNPPIWPT